MCNHDNHDYPDNPDNHDYPHSLIMHDIYHLCLTISPYFGCSHLITRDQVPNKNLHTLRSYMRCHTWVWRVDSNYTLNLALQLIQRARLVEGYILVHVENTKFGPEYVFLREIPTLCSDSPLSAEEPVPCVVQYAVRPV